MTNITGGELLARALANEEVKFVFGLQCPEIDPFLAALDGNGIRFVPIRHEAAGAHMAEGLYKTTGQVAVVLGNPGPGSANLIPGIVTARHEGVPIVAITSQHRAGIVYPSTPATFQGQDQLDLYKPVVKWNAPVFEWTRIPELVRMGFREMWAGRPGPIQLEIPGPTLYAEGDPATRRECGKLIIDPQHQSQRAARRDQRAEAGFTVHDEVGPIRAPFQAIGVPLRGIEVQPQRILGDETPRHPAQPTRSRRPGQQRQRR